MGILKGITSIIQYLCIGRKPTILLLIINFLTSSHIYISKLKEISVKKLSYSESMPQERSAQLTLFRVWQGTEAPPSCSPSLRTGLLHTNSPAVLQHTPGDRSGDADSPRHYRKAWLHTSSRISSHMHFFSYKLIYESVNILIEWIYLSSDRCQITAGDHCNILLLVW